jgi:hypothetical protein
MHINLNIEVHCKRPDWARDQFICLENNNNYFFKGTYEILARGRSQESRVLLTEVIPNFRNDRQKFVTFTKTRYRLYIENNLITERDWNWSNDTFLNENIWISVLKGEQYTVLLDPVIHVNQQADFTIQNLKILNCQTEITKNNNTSYTLKIL